MRDQSDSDNLEYSHLARVFEIDPRLAEFKKYFPQPIPAELALAMKSAADGDEEELEFEMPPPVEHSRAKYARQVDVKEEPEDNVEAEKVADISNEIEKLAIISPRKNLKRRQTKISNFFSKSS